MGEGTWPTIRSTLQTIGISETDFLRECDASFKQGTQFSGWVDGGGAWHEDFSHREEVFSAASYQYILYGMGFATALPRALLNDHDRAKAREKMRETARHGRELSASLPANRELLHKVRRFGLQTI